MSDLSTDPLVNFVEQDVDNLLVDDDVTQFIISPSDPRKTLAEWANGSDEWVRHITGQILSTGSSLLSQDISYAHDLFRQEKGIDERVLPSEPALQLKPSGDDIKKDLLVSKVYDVEGVNAIVTGSVIEPHEGLTILFGENGTGKTGYSRIFKALAGSRTDDVILGNIENVVELPQSAKIDYKIGGVKQSFTWRGERGQVPFTRMSIFDSPSVNAHVDDELEYVFTPAVLALFNHVVAGIKAVQSAIEADIGSLNSESSVLLTRFSRESSVYPTIETLGAATDLKALQAKANNDPKASEKIDALRKANAALEANTAATEILSRQRTERVLIEVINASNIVTELDIVGYNEALKKLSDLEQDYKTFRTAFFSAAALPATPEETWEAFVQSGDRYKTHLKELGVHDKNECLYCRQSLNTKASSLIGKYGDYLADKLSSDIKATQARLVALVGQLSTISLSSTAVFLNENQAIDDKPKHYANVLAINDMIQLLTNAVEKQEAIDILIAPRALDLSSSLQVMKTDTIRELDTLKEHVTQRESTLETNKVSLRELEAAVELSKSWVEISSRVNSAKDLNRLTLLAQSIPKLGRVVTDLSKTVSDQLINQNFDKYFAEECKALRAPNLKLEFIGRLGKAQRRKVTTGKHKPSKVLSEGEQKVLAIADFLAEARLAEITAPVIFDDPVSSLDHRRINEVAKRIVKLSEENQVIVFTHDILFATTVLSLLETTKRGVYYQITDEEGKGKVTRATGPRWDSLSNLKKTINETIAAARLVDGDSKAALVEKAYGWIRSWCEVFTELELLSGVSQRYQPNIRMAQLSQIKIKALPAAIEIVNRIFDEACRYIDSHSQPLPSLSVRPTLTSVEAHWRELQEAKTAYNAATE